MNLHRYFHGILNDNVIATKISECYFIEVNATDFMKNRRFFDYSDLDEYATGTHNCSADAECNNSKGSFNCTCKLGYSGNSTACQGKLAIFSVLLVIVFLTEMMKGNP